MKKTSNIFYLTFLALPLAFVGIPIYLNIADFYAKKFGLNLVLIGSLLAFVRILDALQDPFIGYFSDYLCGKKIARQQIISFSSLALAAFFYLVFNPPQSIDSTIAAIWFTGSLAMTYLCFNFAVINFEAAIAISAKDDQERVTLNSLKEFLGLIGMIFAFIIPGILSEFFDSKQQNYFFLSLVFISLILLSNLLFLGIKEESQQVERKFYKPKFKEILGDKKFIFFLLIFFLNSVAVSLPAANMSFYVSDVLQSAQNIPWFLTTYFISACLFIPLWRMLFNKIGIIRSWMFSIAGAVTTFAFAYFLNSKNSQYFYLICLLSGIFLGADLIAAPSLMAKICEQKERLVSSYFSLWNFFGKIGLMVSASGSLIILGFFHYQPGNPINENLNQLSFFYAALPCLIKIAVAALLLKFKKYEN